MELKLEILSLRGIRTIKDNDDIQIRYDDLYNYFSGKNLDVYKFVANIKIGYKIYISNKQFYDFLKMFEPASINIFYISDEQNDKSITSLKSDFWENASSSECNATDSYVLENNKFSENIEFEKPENIQKEDILTKKLKHEQELLKIKLDFKLECLKLEYDFQKFKMSQKFFKKLF